MLELEHAVLHYHTPAGEVRAVDDVSFTVSAGELVALFGPSGSGKTTLLRLAAAQLPCDSGRVCFEGRDLATLSRREVLDYRRTKLGFVFQNFNLMPGLTAAENVALPLLLRGTHHGEARERALSGLHEVSLAKRAAHYPDRLSGGEQQRVSIARALVGKPALVLADEPTGNLDTETGDVVLRLLSDLRLGQGVAMIVVTHDVRVALRADTVYTMRDGRLVSPDAEAAEFAQ